MYSSSTIQGLDEAISELEKSITSLPDSSTKKKLIKKFEKLKSVRKLIENQNQNQNQNNNNFYINLNHYLKFLIFIVISSFVIYILYVLYSNLTKKSASSNCP